MANYVCPVHEDVVLYPDDEGKDSPQNSVLSEVRIEPPKYCEKCDEYYYRDDCKTM